MRIKDNINPSYCCMVLAIVFYCLGFLFMKRTNVDRLVNEGLAVQEEYIYYDNDGDEHEGKTLLDIYGVGKVLTYRDVYEAPVSIFFLSILIGMAIFHNKMHELDYVIFANCVLGLLLIWLTTKGFIISTIMFWLGIFAAGFIRSFEK